MPTTTAPRPPPGYLKVAQLVFSRGATPLAPKAMPNLMVVVPTSHEVTLTYGATTASNLPLIAPSLR